MRSIDFLLNNVHENMSLTELIDTFEKACKESIREADSDSTMFLFETGVYSFTGTPMLYFLWLNNSRMMKKNIARFTWM